MRCGSTGLRKRVEQLLLKARGTPDLVAEVTSEGHSPDHAWDAADPGLAEVEEAELVVAHVEVGELVEHHTSVRTSDRQPP